VDMASGIHVYRNIAYNNAFAGFFVGGVWRNGDMILYNNVAANSLYGFFLSSLEFDTHSDVNTQLVNNIILSNEAHGVWHTDTDGVLTDTVIDHNLYYNNGWRSSEDGGMWKPGALIVRQGSTSYEYYPALADIQGNTPWESHGVEGDPGFLNYDPDDHDLQDGSWPDFHITTSTNVLDRGTGELPASLGSLLTRFGVVDVAFGSAYDIGRYEAPGVLGSPTARSIRPGGSTQFVLRSHPPDFSDSLAISVSSTPSDLILELGSTILEPNGAVILAVADTHDPDIELKPALWCTITVSATYGQLTQYSNLIVLVGGSGLYLPLIVKGAP